MHYYFCLNNYILKRCNYKKSYIYLPGSFHFLCSSFLCVKPYFPFAWKMPSFFYISFSVNLLVMNYFSLHMIEKLYIHLHIWKILLLDIEFQVGSFFLSVLKHVATLFSHFLMRNLLSPWYLFLSIYRGVFPSHIWLYLRFFSLSLILGNWKIMCYLIFLFFVCLELELFTCRLIVFIIWEVCFHNFHIYTFLFLFFPASSTPHNEFEVRNVLVGNLPLVCLVL